jgi:CubicO group peptidase (beta-lactamase class C family)
VNLVNFPRFVLTAAVMIACPSADQLAHADAIAAASLVSPATQQVRRQVLKADANSFYFQHMADVFDTRGVGRAGAVWPLPHQDQAIHFQYAWQGQTFSYEDFLDRTYTNALIVMKSGKIVTEVYRNRSSAATHFMGWSMTKTFVSTLVGLAVQEGRIHSLDDGLVQYLPELKGGAYNGVTIRQTLQMKSGVAYEERYDGAPSIASDSHELALMQNVRRFVEPALTIGRAHPPGTVFEYKTLDTAVLGWLVERVTDRPIAHYMAEKLWEPLGAEADGFFIMDGPPGVGREFTGAGFNAIARDYARFGQMILNKGFANGRQIVPAAWIAQATQPTDPEGPMGGYGYQWWTAGGSHYALGLEGQYIFIDPAHETVIVKLSYFPPGEEMLYGESVVALQALSASLAHP